MNRSHNALNRLTVANDTFLKARLTKDLSRTFVAVFINCIFILLACAQGVYAQSELCESYAILNVNGTTNIYYDLNYPTANPDLQGTNLGICSTLVLVGGENKVGKSLNHDITEGIVFYRVYSSSPPSFNEVALSYFDNNGCSGFETSQKWNNTTANINLLSGLAAGTYTLEVLTSASRTIEGTGVLPLFINNGGSNYIATFTYCPTSVGTISVTAPLCASGAATATCTPAGGTWSSSGGGITSIDATTGALVLSSTGGVGSVTYSLPASCGSTNLAVNVGAVPTFSSSYSIAAASGANWAVDLPTNLDSATVTLNSYNINAVTTSSDSLSRPAGAFVSFPITGILAYASQVENWVNVDCQPQSVTYTLTGISTDGCYSDSFGVVADIAPQPGKIKYGSSCVAAVPASITQPCTVYGPFTLSQNTVIGSAGSLTVTGACINAGGITLTNNGTLTAPTFTNMGTLTGAGAHIGAVINTGTHNPGN